MPKIEKHVSWTIFKEFEADSLEEAIELAKNDQEQDWEDTDPEINYYVGKSNG